MSNSQMPEQTFPALVPLPLDQLFSIVRTIVREEIAAGADAHNQEKLVSGPEAVNYFSPAISRQTLANWVREGLIPVQKINGKNYYRHTDLLQAGTSLKLYKRTSN